MAAKGKSAPVDPVDEIVRQVTANPYRFISFGDAARLFGFGTNAMTAFVNLGAPAVARKINPDHFKAWLAANAEKVGKIREE